MIYKVLLLLLRKHEDVMNRSNHSRLTKVDRDTPCALFSIPPISSNLNIFLMQTYLNRDKSISGENKKLYWDSVLEEERYFLGMEGRQ